MNELEAMRWQLDRYGAALTQQSDRVFNALEELQRTTLLLLQQEDIPEKIDAWLQRENFTGDADGFFQNKPLLAAFREGKAPDDAVSITWGAHLRADPTARYRMYCHRHIGSHLKHIHSRLGDVGWVYYQDASNTAIQYPFIDQRTAIPSDFDWSTYHTFLSVCPEHNPSRAIQWTPPTVDYAGEGVILSASIPVWHNDVFIGLWSIDLPIRYLYRDFASMKTFPDQKQFIVNNDELLVLHDELPVEIDSDRGCVILQPLSKLGGQWETFNLAAAIDKKERNLTVVDAEGVEWRYCYHFVPEVEWTLFCGLPKVSMEEAAAQRLEQAFQQIGEGNYSHRIESSSMQALPTLVAEFNRMSLRLSKSRQKRKEMESHLRQAQKMESIGTLAGGIAHDFNNILSAVLGYTELALTTVEKETALEHDLQEVYNAGLRAKDLVQQILTFARQSDEERKLIQVDTIVKEVLKFIRSSIPTTIDIKQNIESDSLIMGNATQVHQLMMNLCTNAAHAMEDEGGTLGISVKDITIDRATTIEKRRIKSGNYVEIMVSDTGGGIESHNIQKICEPYFTTKKLGEGTGMGLALVYGIVETYGGEIIVDSTLGKGTVFTMYLPIAKGRNVSLSHKSKELPTGQERILFVDDEVPIVKIASRFLGQLGYFVTTSTSSVEALELFRSKPNEFDLVITDVTMPKMTGDQLAKNLLDIKPDIPIILCTGYSKRLLEEQIVEIGIRAFAYKPIVQEDLAKTVRDVLDEAKK